MGNEQMSNSPKCIGQEVFHEGAIIITREYFPGDHPELATGDNHVVLGHQGWSGIETVKETQGVKPIAVFEVK